VDRSPDVNVGSWIAARAAQRPDHPALIVSGGVESISYAQLDARIDRTAAALRALGIAAGERIAVALRSEPLFLELYFAAARLGAIFVPLNTRLAPGELSFQLGDCRARVALACEEVELGPLGGTRALTRGEFLALRPERAAPPPPLPGGERPQVIMYTSGTTGTPKGAVLPHRKTLYNTLNAELYFGLSGGDVVIAPVPLFHSFGLKILAVPALFAGASLVLVDRFDPLDLQATVARWRGTLLGAVPVMYRRMREAGLEPGRLASLRSAFSAGAPLDVETIRAFAAAGVRLVQGYGQTETSILCCLDADQALARAGSVGRPVRHGEVRVGDASGRAVPPGTRGEVLVRGPIVMLGYWERPEQTRASRIDGWHRTGDLGVMDADGYLSLVGRSREMYISGGENVYPAEVERVLEQFPQVAEVAVVGVPDARWGESGRAFVVPSGPALDAAALLRFAREKLAAYKIPRDVVQVAELPRTPSGKVRKHALLQDR
jgi:acyl-CoA synthetase (AMP-forming)/AMP-acid ligase II